MWKRHTSTGEFGVVIDVHSGSVGCAIIHAIAAADQPELVFFHREHIKILANPDTAGLIRALRHALFSVALKLSEEGLAALQSYDPHAKLERVLFVCGAPWAHTATRFIHVEDKEPFVVTKERVRSLIAEAEHRDEVELQTSALLKELNVALIEHAIINIAINGYFTHDPYGKKGTELSLAHISGLIPQAIVDAVSELEDKVLPQTIHSSHTFALVLFCVIRDMYPHTKHSVCIDISGESTEICIMQDEVLLETYVVPYGTYTFVRDVARTLNTFPEEALTHIKEYSPTMPEALRVAIDDVTKQYAIHIEEAYRLLSERYTIPNHFFLLTSRNLHTYFDNVIRKISEAYIGAHGSLISLNQALVGDVHPESAPDAFFAIEARFFHKLHGCGDNLE